MEAGITDRAMDMADLGALIGAGEAPQEAGTVHAAPEGGLGGAKAIQSRFQVSELRPAWYPGLGRTNLKEPRRRAGPKAVARPEGISHRNRAHRIR